MEGITGDEGERQPCFSSNLLLVSQSFGIAGFVLSNEGKKI